MVGLSIAACDDGNGAGGGGGTPNLSLNGEWKEDGTNTRVSISGSTGRWTYLGYYTGCYDDARKKGYIKVGDQYFRNLYQDGNLRWKGQVKLVTSWDFIIAEGTTWVNCIINMDTKCKSFVLSVTDVNGTQTINWQRY